MKNLSVLLALMVVVFYSCSDSDKNTGIGKNNRTNMLLPSTVPVSQIFLIDEADVLGWQKEFKASNLVEKVFKKALGGEITVYNTNLDENTILTKGEILTALGTEDGTDLSEIKSLYFEEEWLLDTTEPFIFEKKVLCWYPVKYYIRDSVEYKKLIFKIGVGNPKELLAKNIITEFSLEDTINPIFTHNLNKEKLVILLTDYAKSGKIKVWDPVDFTKELNIDDINKVLGKAADTIIIEDPETGATAQKVINKEIDLSEIQSIVFVEDWYYDPSTFAIKKEITGIGPVRYYIKEDGEIIKNIAFMLYFGKEKTKIFND